MARRKKIDPEELKEILKGYETVQCAFCQGKGIDPFDLLSKLSTCQVCGGNGENRIKRPTKECNFCEGSGIDSYTTSRLHCLACGGKGRVTDIKPSKKCPTCEGTGIYPHRPHPAACHICKGQGVVAG